MSIVPPCFRSDSDPAYLQEGASVPISSGQKIVLETDGVASGAIQINKDVDGLLFATIDKQDLTVEGNPATNIISITNDLEGFEPIAVQKVILCGSATVGTENGVVISGDATSGVTIDNALTVNTLNGVAPGSIARVFWTGTLSVPNGATPTTAISFTNQSFDFLNVWEVDQPTKFTIPQNGYYRMFGSAVFAANGTGVRSIFFRNLTAGTSLDTVYSAPTSTNSASVDIEGTYLFSAGTELELWLGQSSGSPLNATAARWEIQLVRAA